MAVLFLDVRLRAVNPIFTPLPQRFAWHLHILVRFMPWPVSVQGASS